MRLLLPYWKLGFVMGLLLAAFVVFTPSRALLLLAAGAAALAPLAFWPPHDQRFEAWMGLLVVVACGAFGAVRYALDLGGIHPWDRGEFFRLYVGAGLIVGIAAVIPYIILRLAFVGPSRRQA